MILNNRKKLLEQIKLNWAKPIDKFRNLDFISFLFETIKSKENKHNFVDNKTWKDLNFNDIFSIIDRNTTPLGQQYLYYSMRKYEADENH